MTKKEKNEKRKKGNKFIAWIILIVLLVILLVASFVFGNDLLEVINLSKDKKDNVIENSNVSNSNKEMEDKISEDELKKLYNIIGINDDSDSCGVQNILTQVSGSINNLSNKDKYQIIYFYAYNNKLTTNISCSEYDMCEGYGGECVSITKDNYEKVTSYYGIYDKPEQLFDATEIYKDKYIFEIPECKMDKYTHDVKYKKENDDVIIIDNVSIEDENQTITYTFKLNGNKEYYLDSIK